MEDDQSLIPLKEDLANFVNYLESTNKHINETEIFDTSLEDFNDIVSKFTKLGSGILKVYTTTQKIMFIKFLKGLSYKINNKQIIDYKTKQKLDNYLSKKQNIEFVYNTIRKALTATSFDCAELLAIILGEILRNQIEMNPYNITIIDALHSMNNYDLNNFYKIYKLMTNNSLRDIRLDKLYSLIDKNSVQISLNKLVTLQILIQNNVTTVNQGFRYGSDDIDPLNTIMKDNEKFVSLYSVSDELFNLLEKAKGQIMFLG